MTQNNNSHSHSPDAKLSHKDTRSRRRGRTYSLAWLEEPYNHARGEMALWVAVITQAMMDALNRANTAEAAYYKHEAIHWLTGGSKDFIMVCHYAGLDPDYVRRNAKRALVSPVPWRAEPRKGKRYLERKAYRQSRKKEALREEQPVQYKAMVINYTHRARI